MARWISLRRPSGSLLRKREWITFRRPVDQIYVDDRNCYCGLIEDKQFWLMSYATSDVQPAQQPSGKLLGIKPAKPAQPHKVNCFVNQPAAGTSIMDIQPAEI